jgi:TM2 domain-containing membrane protein YozV
MLWFLSGFGALGFHRFYLGKIPSGLLWMFTGGLGMAGAIYDFFTLPYQVQEANLRKQIGNNQNYNASIDGKWRYASDASTRFVHKETIEQTILRVAKKNSGLATVSEVALEANVPIEEAKKALDALVDKGFAELRVRKSGTLVYAFPEFMDTDVPLEDF